MTLPAPRLDDRTFQDIVDDAKRRITRTCPDWNDHNVSDPGVAMIEHIAWATEMLMYRLNQVPDKMFVNFLSLMGIELFGSSAASTQLLFSLTAPQAQPVLVPAGTQVATDRIGSEEPVVFMTERDLVVMPPLLTSCLTRTQGQFTDCTDSLRLATEPVVCFGSLTPGDAVYFGFVDSLAGNLIKLTVVTGAEGAGIDPDRPPLRWQTWTGDEWADAVVLSDGTDALNAVAGGEVTLLLAPRHEPAAVAQTRAHWLRCRLVTPPEDAPTYARSPVINSLRAVSLGGAVPALHAEPAPSELLGLSTGEPGQAFRVGRSPVLPRTPGETVRVIAPRSDGSGTVEDQIWTEVDHFGQVGRTDRVFTWSDADGEIRFGPQVRELNGQARQHGAIPEVDARVAVTGYRFGGGRRGNVGAGRLTVLRSSIPFVASVTNLAPAVGGVDAETIDNAKVRGPLTLRTGDRAVTAVDFERMTEQSTPRVGRSRCIAPDPGKPVRVLVVPRIEVPSRTLALADLALPPELVGQVSGYLDQRRLLTTQVQVEEPFYQGLMVVAQVRAAVGMRVETVREGAVDALYDYINPLVGGPDGTGWPFGHPVDDGDIHVVLRGVPGVLTVARVY
ncbi:MAG: putative baseplate assembly protein, partial [Propionibacteriaceae bacterium]